MKVERLREVRKSRNLSQRALGQKLGWSQLRIATIEGGLSIKRETAERLAVVLLCDVSDLVRVEEATLTFKVSDLPAEVLELLRK